MKEIKLSGKERTLIRAVGFALPVSGQELVDATHLAAEDLAPIVNGMIEVGYLESDPAADQIPEDQFLEYAYEVNPGYAHALRLAMKKRL